MLLAVPILFSSLVLVYGVLNSRYRAPFIPEMYLLSLWGLWIASASLRAPAPPPKIDRSGSP